MKVSSMVKGLLKKSFLDFFSVASAKRGFADAPKIKHLQHMILPAHPCAGQELPKNCVFHQLLKTALVGLMASGFLPLANAADSADDILPKVHNIILEANGCTEQFAAALEEANYGVVTNKSLADAIFKIDIQSMDESLGAAAHYAVSLQTLDGFELFGQSGAEDSTDQAELCEDISEDMVEAMVERSSAIP